MKSSKSHWFRWTGNLSNKLKTTKTSKTTGKSWCSLTIIVTPIQILNSRISKFQGILRKKSKKRNCFNGRLIQGGFWKWVLSQIHYQCITKKEVRSQNAIISSRSEASGSQTLSERSRSKRTALLSSLIHFS
jgi:hypothetical protein